MGRSTIYNNNITEDYDKVSGENRKLVKEYLQYCKSNDKSPQTIHQYEEWLKVFFCWNLHENDDMLFTDLKKRDFVRYIGYLREIGASPSRIASLKSVLSSLSSEIEMLYEDIYPNFRNQLRGLEAVHITRVREKTVMSPEQVEKALNSLVEAGEYQAACYLALVCASGARKAELIQMKPEFFVEENEIFDGYMYKTPLIRTKGRGKIGKQIRKYIVKSMFKPYFDLWMKYREENNIHCEYLFVTKYGQEDYVPATIGVADSLASKISSVMGEDFYSHAGRHFFATLLKRKKFPDDIIIQIFGWTSGEMLKIYNDIPPEEMMDEFFKNFEGK